MQHITVIVLHKVLQDQVNVDFFWFQAPHPPSSGFGPVRARKSGEWRAGHKQAKLAQNCKALFLASSFLTLFQNRIALALVLYWH